MQEEFKRAVRASKAEAPQPVNPGLTGTVSTTLDLGKLTKLPILGQQIESTNFEWSLLSGSHEVPRPDVRLIAISTEWEQSLTSIQLNFSGRLES